MLTNTLSGCVKKVTQRDHDTSIEPKHLAGLALLSIKQAPALLGSLERRYNGIVKSMLAQCR